MLEKQPRFLKVLETRRSRESRFGYPPKGRFHGLAVMEGYGTYMAQVAEISLADGKVKVHRIYCATDCGQQVNPDTVVAQIESSVAVRVIRRMMWGEINMQDGKRPADQFRQLPRGPHE